MRASGERANTCRTTRDCCAIAIITFSFPAHAANSVSRLCHATTTPSHGSPVNWTIIWRAIDFFILARPTTYYDDTRSQWRFCIVLYYHLVIVCYQHSVKVLLWPTYPVSQKRPPFYRLNNSVKNWPILILFGMLNPEKIWHEHLTDLPNPPVRCSHFTLGNQKKSFFNIIIHILQIIYVSSEENK